ncbi:MAG: hypothetical protein JST31_12240 [Actinobacteria bacterium]|nr:hypothetical protein [Actinomycetota bacterium]
MALPPADPKRHRRALRRRALIGWIGGGALFALLVAAAVLGGDRRKEVETIPAHAGGLLDYHMTAEEFDRLQPGESESEVLDQLGKIGLPEGETELPFIRLFPPHPEALICSYWEISDRAYTIARLCFSRGEGVLREKLERDLSGAFEGETTVRA